MTTNQSSWHCQTNLPKGTHNMIACISLCCVNTSRSMFRQHQSRAAPDKGPARNPFSWLLWSNTLQHNQPYSAKSSLPALSLLAGKTAGLSLTQADSHPSPIQPTALSLLCLTLSGPTDHVLSFSFFT